MAKHFYVVLLSKYCFGWYSGSEKKRTSFSFGGWNKFFVVYLHVS